MEENSPKVLNLSKTAVLHKLAKSELTSAVHIFTIRALYLALYEKLTPGNTQETTCFLWFRANKVSEHAPKILSKPNYIKPPTEKSKTTLCWS